MVKRWSTSSLVDQPASPVEIANPSYVRTYATTNPGLHDLGPVLKQLDQSGASAWMALQLNKKLNAAGPLQPSSYVYGRPKYSTVLLPVIINKEKHRYLRAYNPFNPRTPRAGTCGVGRAWAPLQRGSTEKVASFFSAVKPRFGLSGSTQLK